MAKNDFLNTITIEFKPDGDKNLVKAINSLNKATRDLLKAQASLQKTAGSYISTQKKSNTVTGLAVRNFRNLKNTVTDSGVAFSVLRSKLLLVSFATGLFASSIGRTIKALEQQQLAQKKLESAIKSTGNATGITAKTMMNYASSLQAVTKFGDEQIISAQALLLTFTKIGRDVFPDAIEASLNLSEAMGQDLQQTVIQVGKALNDPIQGLTALRRVGIQFNSDQQALIKNFVATNKVASAQKIILQELDRQFGGMAVTATNTIGGALTQLSNSYGDLLERIGAKVAPTLQSVADAIMGSTMLLMSEREKEIAILQKLGFSEELVGQKRISMYKETLSALQDLGVGTGLHFDTIQDGQISLDSLTQQYGTLTNSLKTSTQLMEEDEKSIQKLGEAYDISRSKMEFYIKQKMSLNKGIGEFIKGGIVTLPQQILNLKSGLDLQTDATFLAIVANREHKESIEDNIKSYGEMIATLKALMEAMGHEFSSVIVEGNKVTIESTKQALEGVQLVHNAFSALTSTYKQNVADREKAELDSLRRTDRFKNASSQAQMNMEEEVTSKFADERKRIFALEKASNMASVVMNTASAIMKAVALMPPAGGFLAPVIGAMGATQLALIASAKPPKFQQGGLIGGRPHSQGGTIIEAERGEFIMSRNAVNAIGTETLNKMNQSGMASNITINVSAPLVDDSVLDSIIPAINEAIQGNKSKLYASNLV